MVKGYGLMLGGRIRMRNGYDLIVIVFMICLLSYSSAHADSAPLDCKKLSQSNPNSSILCKGTVWIHGEPIQDQGQSSSAYLPTNSSNMKVVKVSNDNYEFIAYKRAKDINGNEFTTEKPGVIEVKSGLLSEKYALEQTILKENKYPNSMTIVGNGNSQQATQAVSNFENIKGERRAELERKLSEINTKLELIDVYDRAEAQKKGLPANDISRIIIPPFDVKKVAIPRFNDVSGGDLGLTNKDVTPGYEFTFYNTVKDTNGKKHIVVGSRQKLTRQSLEDNKAQLMAVNDPYNINEFNQKRLAVINAMLSRINELEKE